MTGLVLLIGVVALFVIAGVNAQRPDRKWSCDACHIEVNGGSALILPHTCSKRRAVYRDTKGDVYEFGRRQRRGGQTA